MGQVTKGIERSYLEGRTTAEDKAGGWAGKSERRPGNMSVLSCLRLGYLVIRHGHFFFRNTAGNVVDCSKSGMHK